MSNPDRWRQPLNLRPSRRQILRMGATGVILVTGAALDHFVLPLFDGPKNPLQSETEAPAEADFSKLPDSIVGHFPEGQTQFAFSKEFTSEERERIKAAVDKYYEGFSGVYGDEPRDISGNVGVTSVFSPAKELGAYALETEAIVGTSQHNIKLSSLFDDLTVAEALSHIFWGPEKIGAHGQLPYNLLHYGIIHGALESVLDEEDKGLQSLHRVFNLNDQPFTIANKQKAATYGTDLLVATGARRMAAASALHEAIKHDSELLPRFNAQYRNLVEKTNNPEKDLTIQTIRNLFRNCYEGSFRQLQADHPILAEAIPGRHVLIAPSFNTESAKVALVAFVFERTPSCFVEIPLSGVQVEVEVDEVKQTDRRYLTNQNGVCVVMDVLNQNTIPNRKTIKVSHPSGTNDIANVDPVLKDKLRA